MAIGRLSVKVGKAGKAGPHAAYIAREGQYADRLERGEKLEATEAGNMPAWAQHSPQLFWQAADQYERKGGTTYREFEVALPRELTPEQRLDLVRDFVAQEIGDRHAYQFAIHTPTATDGGEQPHAHIMFSERQRDGIDRDPEQYFKRYNGNNPALGGARKTFGPLESHCDMSTQRGERAAERAQLLQQLRSRWEQTCNRHLEMAGEQARIDMRSYRDQGLDQLPTPKMLPSEGNRVAREAAAIRAEIVDLAPRIAARDRQLAEIRAEVEAVAQRLDARPLFDEGDSKLLRDMPTATLREARETLGEARSFAKHLDARDAREREPKPAPAPRAPEPVPKVDRSGTDLAQLLAQGERVTAPPSPSVAPQAQPEPAPALTLGQHQAVIERRIKERTEAIGREREAKATAPARERLQAAQERLQAGRQRIQGEDRQAFGEASAARTAQRAAEAEAKRLAGEAEQWRAAHWMKTKLGSTGPADDLDRQAEQHRRHALEQARKADEAEARREALAREERQLEREVGVAEKGVETARQELRRQDKGLDGYTAARRVIDEYRREHPDYAQEADQRAAQERERQAQQDAERQAQREQSQDRGMSR